MQRAPYALMIAFQLALGACKPEQNGGASELTEKTQKEIVALGSKLDAVEPAKIAKNLKARAKKWKPDAQLQAIEVTRLGKSGTVDLNDDMAVVMVTYMSPSANELRRYEFHQKRVNHTAFPMPASHVGVPPLKIPKCSFSDLGSFVKSKNAPYGSVTLGPHNGKLTLSVGLDDPTRTFFLSPDDCAVLSEH